MPKIPNFGSQEQVEANIAVRQAQIDRVIAKAAEEAEVVKNASNNIVEGTVAEPPPVDRVIMDAPVVPGKSTVQSKREANINFEILDESNMMKLLAGIESKELNASSILNIKPKDSSKILRWVNYKGYNGEREESAIGFGFKYATLDDVKNLNEVSDQRLIIRNNGQAIVFEDVILMIHDKLTVMLNYKAKQEVMDNRIKQASEGAQSSATNSLNTEHSNAYNATMRNHPDAKIEFYRGPGNSIEVTN